MRLLITYVVIVFVFGFFGVELGIEFDHFIPDMPNLSIAIALAIFFGVLIVGWPISVYITERWLMGGKPAESESK